MHHEGTITKVLAGKGFGFISSPNQPDTFFHAADIIDPALPFDESLQERRVRFIVVATEKGPRAKGVRAV